MHIFGVRRGPLRGHVGAMLGSSWHLQGILTSLLIILATKVDIRGGKSLFGGGHRGPGGPWGGGFRGREYGSTGRKPQDLTRQWAKGPANFCSSFKLELYGAIWDPI